MIIHFHISFRNANHWPYIFADFHYFHLLIFINWIKNAMWHPKNEPRGWKYYNTSQESYMSRSSFYKVKSCWILREGQTLANFFTCAVMTARMWWFEVCILTFFFERYFGKRNITMVQLGAIISQLWNINVCSRIVFNKLISSEKLFGNFSGDCPHLTRSANSL